MKKTKVTPKAFIFSVVRPCNVTPILKELWEEETVVDIISVVPHGKTDDGMFEYLATYMEKIK